MLAAVWAKKRRLWIIIFRPALWILRICIHAMMTGHCYLDLHDYETALKYYFRVEYTDPGNLKILRPIAFCYFALGQI